MRFGIRASGALRVGVAAAVAGMCVVSAGAAPALPSNFAPVLVNGSATAFSTAAGQGAAFNVLYDGGIYHLWYRADASTLTVSELRHATSTDGINFTTVGGAFSFATNPFPTGTAPALYYEAVSKVGTDFKLVHWTYTGGAGTYPNYDYNNSVSNAGASAANTVLTHQGPIGGGTIGQTAGAFGLLGGAWYGQCGNTGQEICRATYADGSPPSITTPLYPSVLNASSLFTSLGIPTGYINNHGDIATGSSGLDAVFTVRDGTGSRFNKQVYYANSTDNGATWSTITPLIAGTPTLLGVPFATGVNFAHPELVLGAANLYKLYVSTQDAQGNFIIAVAGNQAAAAPTSVPTLGAGPLAALAGMMMAAGLWLRRRSARQRG